MSAPPPDGRRGPFVDTRVDRATALARFDREAKRGICDTGRYCVRTWSWGDGPPLVLIHGVSDSARSFVPIASLLSSRFRCIAYDLPTGRDDGARLGRHRHADLVDDLLALLTHWGQERAFLFGASLGSTVALAALQRQPDRFPRAVLQGALAYRRLTWLELLMAGLFRLLPGSLAHLPFYEQALFRTTGAAFAHRPADFWTMFVEVTSRAPLRAFAHQILLLHRLDLRPLLASIRQPILLVSGADDRVVPARDTDLVQAGLPNAQRVILEGCGHVPCYTHPEILADLLHDFLLR